MMDTRLIMLEGLPGTGKSTNSYFLNMQLAFNGKSVKWIHEVARPHPTLFFSEASFTYEEYDIFLKTYPEVEQVLNQIAVFRKNTVGIDLLEIEWNHLDIINENAYQALQKFDVWTFSLDKYAEVTLEKWAFFTEKILNEKTEVYLLDSSIFQFQIFSFLLKNAPYEDLNQFVHNLINIVKPLKPNLIYFYRENAEDTISYLEKIRGTQFMESIWERDKFEPYYCSKPKGAEGHKQFLRDYANIAKKLFETVDCRKISIEITSQDWKSYENKMLSFLGTERKSSPKTFPRNGIYKNDILNLEIEVNGLTMKDPNGTVRSLNPKSDNEFYVECLPVFIRFNELDQIVISGEQICERWTTLGTQFMRI